MKETQKLATFKIDRKKWEKFLARASRNGTSGAALLKWFVDAYLDGKIDPEQYQETKEIDKIIDSRLSPIFDRLEELNERLGESNGELAVRPPMTAPVKGEYQAPSSNAPDLKTTIHREDTGNGISNTQFAKLCGTGKRQLRAIRDDPEELASFSRERTGQTYEYRDGKYWGLSRDPDRRRSKVRATGGNRAVK